ncbi:MAG TPA: methyltransferase [Bryobacteraceae bacterium]|jgi:hypothetical protein
MLDGYTAEARRVLFFGRCEANGSATEHIEAEHLLLALLYEDRDIAARFFRSPDAASLIRPKIMQKFKSKPQIPAYGDMPLSLAAKQVLQGAVEEAAKLQDYHVAPAHLLMGLLRDKESLAAEILKEHGVTAEQVRTYLVQQPKAKGTPQQSTDTAMIQMITGFWVSRAVYTAAKLGIADLLKGGVTKSVIEMASATGSHPEFLYRMMRALSSVGVFHELEGQKFTNSPMSETLESDRLGTLRYFAIAELGQEHYSAWEEFPYSVRTGGLAFTEKFKRPVFDYYRAHPAEAEVFNRSMSNLTEWVTGAVMGAYDFSAFHKIVDVGGGQGAFLAAMLGVAKSARGVLFDDPQVIAEATRLKDGGLGERAEQVGGDFFAAVPAGGDLYTLKMILHDWSDEDCIAILRNVRKGIVTGGKVVIVETVLGPGPDAPMKNFLDLNMMVMTGGRERTEAGFRYLLEKSGFKFGRVISTASPMSVIEGTAD